MQAIAVNSFGTTVSKKEKKKIEMPKFLYPLAYHKKHILIFAIILLFVGVMGTIALADPLEDEGGMLALIGTMIDTIFGSDGLEHTQKLLIIKSGGFGSLKVGDYNMTNVMMLLNTLNKVFVNIGEAFLLIYWGMSFFEMLMANNSQLIVEQMIRKFIFLIVGVVLVQNAMDIVFFISNIGTSLTQTVVSAISDTDVSVTIEALKQAIYDDCTETGSGGLSNLVAGISNWGNKIGYLVQLIVPWLFCWICQLLISITCWSRFVEICVTAVISPVMFADISADRFMQSNCVRSLKNVVALSITGAIIMLSLYICSQISLGIVGDTAISTKNVLSASFNHIIIGVVKVGMISKASSLAKQAIGM